MGACLCSTARRRTELDGMHCFWRRWHLHTKVAFKHPAPHCLLYDQRSSPFASIAIVSRNTATFGFEAVHTGVAVRGRVTDRPFFHRQGKDGDRRVGLLRADERARLREAASAKEIVQPLLGLANKSGENGPQITSMGQCYR